MLSKILKKFKKSLVFQLTFHIFTRLILQKALKLAEIWKNES